MLSIYLKNTISLLIRRCLPGRAKCWVSSSSGTSSRPQYLSQWLFTSSDDDDTPHHWDNDDRCRWWFLLTFGLVFVQLVSLLTGAALERRYNASSGTGCAVFDEQIACLTFFHGIVCTVSIPTGFALQRTTRQLEALGAVFDLLPAFFAGGSVSSGPQCATASFTDCLSVKELSRQRVPEVRGGGMAWGASWDDLWASFALSWIDQIVRFWYALRALDLSAVERAVDAMRDFA